MIWDRIGVLKTLFPDRRSAGRVAARWAAADEADDELARDLIRMGGLMTKLPARYAAGVEVPEPIDPLRLARAEGRRELALELLALMKVGPFELSELLGDDHRD